MLTHRERMQACLANDSALDRPLVVLWRHFPVDDQSPETLAAAGFYHSPIWKKDFPRLQILTIEQLLTGKEIEMPPSAYGTFKQAEKISLPYKSFCSVIASRRCTLGGVAIPCQAGIIP